MELSYFLAQLMGLSLAVFALIGLLRPRIVHGAMQNFEKDTLVSLFFGFMGIVVGLSIILTHNVWELSWVGVITLFGWAGLVKGVTYLLAPDVLLNFGTAVYSHTRSIKVVLVPALLLGLYLAYKGFGY